MSPVELRQRMTGVFRRVFNDEALAIHDGTTANDIPGWDSLRHVELVVAIEQEFRVRFTAREVIAAKCHKDMEDTVLAKLARQP